MGSHALRLFFVVFLFATSLVVVIARPRVRDWTPVEDLIKDGIANRVFPGAAVVVGNRDGVLYSSVFGTFTYEPQSSPVTNTSLFDMASLTKVSITTTAAAQFYQRGEVTLDLKISAVYPEYATNGKESITVENLLLHNAGLYPDPIPNYEKQSFGCPESFKQKPQQVFTCMEKIFFATMNQTLKNPVGKVMVYSDLSMITLMYVLGKYAKQYNHVSDADVNPECPLGQHGSEQCYFEAYVRKYIFEPLNMQDSMFKPAASLKSRCLPSWNETDSYRHELIQGYVSDENAYAMGGYAGHAGFFTTITQIPKLLHDLMFTNKIVSAEAMKLFTAVKDPSFSSRALGWDTNVNQDSNGTCQKLSKRTYMHTGFSGTSICCDPERGVYVSLLTNSKYPDKGNTRVQAYRNKLSAIISQMF